MYGFINLITMNETLYAEAFANYNKALVGMENYKDLSITDKNKGIAKSLTLDEIDILIQEGILEWDFKINYNP